jgi:glycogen debranching enzyme
MQMAFKRRDQGVARANSIDIKEEMFNRAVDILKTNSTSNGIRAAATVYNQVWSRDSFITFLGANLLGDQKLLDAAKNTLITLGKAASPMGMIPVNYDLDRKERRLFHAGATDAPSWYILGLANLYSVTQDSDLLGMPLDCAMDAYRWLRYQDTNGAILIDSMPGSDWMDSSVQRQGKVLYNNLLFLMATKCINNLCDASGKDLDAHSGSQPIRIDFDDLKSKLNRVFDPTEKEIRSGDWPNYHDFDKDYFSNPPKGRMPFYPQFITMDYVDMHFDSLSNMMSILFDVARPEMARNIMSYVDSNNLAKPYPIRVLDPVVVPGDRYYKHEYNAGKPDYWRNDAYCYHNGGVWPFVGGFYVMARQKMGYSDASRALEDLAIANSMKRNPSEHGFNEWFHGRTFKLSGQDGQSWNAGLYVAAYLYAKGADPFKFLK